MRPCAPMAPSSPRLGTCRLYGDTSRARPVQSVTRFCGHKASRQLVPSTAVAHPTARTRLARRDAPCVLALRCRPRVPDSAPPAVAPRRPGRPRGRRVDYQQQGTEDKFVHLLPLAIAQPTKERPRSRDRHHRGSHTHGGCVPMHAPLGHQHYRPGLLLDDQLQHLADVCQRRERPVPALLFGPVMGQAVRRGQSPWLKL